MSEKISPKDKQRAIKMAYTIVGDKRNVNRYCATTITSKTDPSLMFTYSGMMRVLGGMYAELDEAPAMQKPLTLEELTKSVFQIPCWIEVIGRDLQPDVIDRDSAGMFSKLATHGFTLYYDPETYGKVWRAWASRPTDEERAAAPWEDDDE